MEPHSVFVSKRKLKKTGSSVLASVRMRALGPILGPGLEVDRGICQVKALKVYLLRTHTRQVIKETSRRTRSLPGSESSFTYTPRLQRKSSGCLVLIHTKLEHWFHLWPSEVHLNQRKSCRLSRGRKHVKVNEPGISTAAGYGSTIIFVS